MDWLTIIGVVLIIEGIMPLLFPRQWLSYVQKLAQEPIGTIRHVGAVLFAVGAILLWIK